MLLLPLKNSSVFCLTYRMTWKVWLEISLRIVPLDQVSDLSSSWHRATRPCPSISRFLTQLLRLFRQASRSSRSICKMGPVSAKPATGSWPSWVWPPRSSRTPWSPAWLLWIWVWRARRSSGRSASSATDSWLAWHSGSSSWWVTLSNALKICHVELFPTIQ